MSTRSQHARMLLDAVDNLKVLSTESPMPEKCLELALQKSLEVWEATASYIDPPAAKGSRVPIRKRLRIAVVSMRGLVQSVEKHEALSSEDVASVKKVIADLQEISVQMITDQTPKTRRDPNSDFSALGLRYESLQDLAGAKPFVVASASMHRQPETSGVEEDADRFASATAMRSKLPTRIADGDFVTTKMPLLVYPKAFNQSALDRSDLEWTPVSGAHMGRIPGLPAVADITPILLYNQLLVGLSNEDADNEEVVKDIIKRISKRMGPHTNPLSINKIDTTKVIRSPGNHLAWIWLVPNHQIDSGAISVRSVAFPWMSESKPIDRKKLRDELTDLEAQQNELLRQGKHLDPRYLTRISELREALDINEKTETPAQKSERLRRERAELEARVKKKYAKLFAQKENVEEELREVGPPSKSEDSKVSKQRRQLKAELKRLDEEIEAGRREVADSIRRSR